MTDSVDIHLPSAVWLAKLTPTLDPAILLANTDHCAPSNWFPTPLSTGLDFGGILSLADIGHGVEPNLSPTGSLPLPGDRIVLTRTGRRVEAFGALEITAVTVSPHGGVRIGHRPLCRFDFPVDLRHVRRKNQLLDDRWDQLFGINARDRRLLPLVDEDVALCFTAFGLSLEALFAPTTQDQPVPAVSPVPAWSLDHQVAHITITTHLARERVASGVVAYHGVANAVLTDPLLASVEISAPRAGHDLLLSLRRPDSTSFTIAQSLGIGERFRFNQSYQELRDDVGASTLVAVETDDQWHLVDMDSLESHLLQNLEPGLVDSALRDIGFPHR